MPDASRTSRAGTPQPFQLLQLPVAEPFKTSQTFAVAKLALGLSNLVFAIVSLGLLFPIALKFTPFMWPWIDDIYLSLAVASIMWHVGELITVGIYRDWRSICPGAHVGAHLILWAIAVLLVPTYCMELAYELNISEINADCDPYCGMTTFRSQGDFNSYFGKIGTLTALSVMMMILHFVLLVMACIETDRKGRYEKKAKVTYLVAAPGVADSRMYDPPLAQPPQGNEGTVLTTQPSHHE